MFEYFTLDDFEFRGKIVGVRVDINSPIKNGKIMLNQRIRECIKTLSELQEKGARVVVLAHQGRKGDDDCISLQEHVKELEKLLKTNISFSPQLYSKEVEKSIAQIEEGQIMVLENLRFYEDETNADLKNNKIKKLEKFFDYYVFDAFSLAHRNHTSVTGFSKIPNIAGRVMEKELKGLHFIDHAKKPHVYALGGAKPDDLIPLIKDSLENKHAETILLSGVIGEIALLCRGNYIGCKKDFLEEKGWLDIKDDLSKLLKQYPQQIELPRDVALISKGKRIEINVSQLENNKELLDSCYIEDIGTHTLSYYDIFLQQANSIYFKGPPGNFEKKNAEKGTKKLLESITQSQAFTFMGGGHSVTAAYDYGFLTRFSYISLAGGALVKFLEGKELPGINHLEKSHRYFEKLNEDFIVIGSNTLDIGVKIPQKLSTLALGSKIKIEEDFKETVGGGGINVASALSRLGAKTGYLGKLSHETYDKIKEALDKNKISIIETKKSKKPGAKSILLNTADNDRVIFTYRGQNGTLGFNDFDKEELRARNYYLTGLTGEGFETELEITKFLEQQKKDHIICYNPSSYLIESEPRIYDIIKRISVIIVNVDEAQTLTQKQKIKEVLRALYDLGPQVVVVTAGNLGSYAYDGSKEYRSQAVPTKVVDSTGAGDSFAATFFYFYSKGYGINKAMRYASINSASVVSTRGVGDGLLYREDIVGKE